MFVSTERFTYACDFLKDTCQMVLLGSPGCGKTTASLMLMRRYRKRGYNYHFIDSIENFDIVNEVDLSKSNILVFDDLFGKSGLADFEKWTKLLDKLDVMFNKDQNKRPSRRSEVTNMDVEKTDFKVIFTSRNYLFKMAQPFLGGYKNTIMKNGNVVDLSSRQLSKEERREMLVKHYAVSGTNLTDKDIQDIVECTENTIGFPYSCKMFMKTKLFQKNPERFFSQPFVYLKDHLETLLLSNRMPGQASALVLMALLDGKMSIADLDKNTRKLPDMETYLQYLEEIGMTNKRSDVIKGAEALEGSYLEVHNKLYFFSHPTVYDAVACIMGKHDPKFVLQHFPMKFIHDYVQLEGAGNLPNTSDYDWVVLVPSVHSASFVRRFTDETKRANISQVFRHSVFEQEDFVDDLIRELKEDESFPEVLHQTDKTHGQCLLFWSMFSPSSHFVEKLIESTEFGEGELLEGFLGCAIYGNIKSMDILIRMSQSASFFSRVGSVTIGDILQKKADAGTLMKQLSQEQNKPVLTTNPFPGGQNDSLLHLACIRSHKDVVERFLNLGCDVNSVGELGRTPLMYASRGGDHKVADMLLKAGADIGAKDEEGACALHLAARGGHVGVMRIFLDNGVDINERGEHERTPLLYACRYGYPEFVRFCLDKGGDLSLKCDTDSCLHLACKSGSLETVKILHEKGMDIEEPGQMGRTPIMFACRHGHLDIVNYLKEKKANLRVADKRGENIFHLSVLGGNVDIAMGMLPPNATMKSLCDSLNKSPFEKASAMGHFNMLKYFIEKKIELVPIPLCLISASYNGHFPLVEMLTKLVEDVNHRGEKARTALMSACFSGHTEIAKLLISKNADTQLTDEYGINCWQSACTSGKADIVKLLLKQGFNVKTPCQNGMTSLMIACRLNHLEMFEFLLERDRNAVNILDENGLTCLHHCCFGKHDNPQIVKMLIDLQINVNCRDTFLKTPAMYSCRNGLKEILHCLLDHGADLQLACQRGQNCLHYASFSNTKDMIDFLISCDININSMDKRSTTPLMLACFSGKAIAVDHLLDLHADATILDVNGQSCVHMACGEGHIPVLQVLQEYGVDMEMEGKFGRTPLMYACQNGKVEVVDYLRETGIRVLAEDENSANALHMCCMSKKDNRDMARKLLQFGINVNSRDKNGMTPIMYACSRGNVQLYDFLYSKGANIKCQSRLRKTCLDFAIKGGDVELVQKIKIHQR